MNSKGFTRDPTGQFSIKAVSQATGLSVETLRAWERRYEVVRPERDASGRRSYAASDVARLRLLRSATELGHSISRMSRLAADELAQLVADSGGHARQGPARGQTFVDRALDATENSDPNSLEEVLTSAIALLPANEVVHTVLGPLVYEVGERWHGGSISIAQEHMVSEIVRRLLIAVARGYLRSDSAPAMVLATLSGERHELGILMCGWMAAARRYRTHYLGIDCPPAEIARFALEVEARVVLISMVMPEQIVPAMQQLSELAELLNGRCDVWVGGTAARHLDYNTLPAGCVLLPGGQDFEHRLDLLLALSV